MTNEHEEDYREEFDQGPWQPSEGAVKFEKIGQRQVEFVHSEGMWVEV